jgi:HSP20 family molecular chaperone IbpA
MFKKNKCGKCGKKVEDKYSFCHFCGSAIISKNEEDFGMLGKNDSIISQNSFGGELFGGINSGILNKMLNGAMKMLENEMKKDFETQNTSKTSRTNFELYINGKKVTPRNMNPQMMKSVKKETEKQKRKDFTKEQIQKFASLKREEPKTNIRRLSNKLIYELEMPDVNSAEDVSIINLESSIEIKAIGEKKAYAKIIPINLPLDDLELSGGKLVLEFGIKN